ncbi:hypothetical protein [Termitidicoccus mucosus]|uniref:hypothetical protein n=2 Tax=Termitidicoccus mucosus TaxID=1184151 RepID=UPI003182EAF8
MYRTPEAFNDLFISAQVAEIPPRSIIKAVWHAIKKTPIRDNSTFWDYMSEGYQVIFNKLKDFANAEIPDIHTAYKNLENTAFRENNPEWLCKLEAYLDLLKRQYEQDYPEIENQKSHNPALAELLDKLHSLICHLYTYAIDIRISEICFTPKPTPYSFAYSLDSLAFNLMTITGIREQAICLHSQEFRKNTCKEVARHFHEIIPLDLVAENLQKIIPNRPDILGLYSQNHTQEQDTNEPAMCACGEMPPSDLTGMDMY